MIGNQPEALLRLLADDDGPTIELIKDQLIAGGLAAVPPLRAVLNRADARAARHLREVLLRIEERQADALFAQLCSGFAEHGDLEDAAWRLATTFFPGDDFLMQRELLDEWGSEVKRRLPKAYAPLDEVETLAEFLSEEVGLQGNVFDYYAIDNSLLPTVIESRRGIPIAVSFIYMLVADRAGLTVEGVSLPGHFLVRHKDIFFDPFHRGRRVGLDECRDLLEEQNLSLSLEHLAPATPRQMLLRMLTNIYIVAEHDDPPLAAKVGNWMEQLRR